MSAESPLQRAHHQQLLAEGVAWLAAERPLRVLVRGTCMGDGLRSLGSVQVLSQRHYWPGDVVVGYWPGQGLRTHRVIGGYRRHGTWKVLTQADQADRPDSAIPVRQVVGKVIAGDVSPQLVQAPPRDRLWALGRFCGFLIYRVVGKCRR